MSDIVQPCGQCGRETAGKQTCPVCAHPVRYLYRPKKKPPLERVVKAAIRAALIKEGCMTMVHNVDNRQMSTGLGKGVSDLICIVPPRGRFLAIEVKRPGSSSRTSDDQESFMRAVRTFGGVAGVVSSVEEALVLLDEARHT